MKNTNFTISTDKEKLDLTVIHNYLKNAYWSIGRPKEVIVKSIEGSLCFGMYKEAEQVGFARVVSDGVIFAYLADVFILPKYQGNGLGKQLVQTIMDYPTLKSVSWLLKTKDAHGLYAQYGFELLDDVKLVMQKKT